MQNVSHENHENHLIFMRMTVQVTYIFVPIVSHIAHSFCHRGKNKLGIGLFIHELPREPLISCIFKTFLYDPNPSGCFLSVVIIVQLG